MRHFILLLLLCGHGIHSHACLLAEQLLKMQSEKLSSIHGFLSKEGWYSGVAMSDQDLIVFDYTLTYDRIIWNKSGQGSIELYYKVGKPTIVLYYPDQYCYDNLFKHFSSKQEGAVSILENRLTTKFQKGDVSVQFEEGQGAYYAQNYKILVLSESKVRSEIAFEKEKAAKVERMRLERKDESERTAQQASLYFNSGQFELALEEYRKIDALEMFNGERVFDFGSLTWVAEKMRECEFAVCNRFVQSAQELLTSKNYSQAILSYQRAIECHAGAAITDATTTEIRRIEGKMLEAQLSQKYDTGEEYFLSGSYDMALLSFEEATVLSKGSRESALKLEDLKNRIKEAKSNEFFRVADSLYNAKQFRKAIESYGDVLKLNPSNKAAKEKVAAAEKILDILHQRRTITFKYEKINSDNYLAFKSDVLKLLSTQLEAQASGFIQFETSLSFDTLGKNTSAPRVLTIDNTGFEEGLQKVHTSSRLTPPKLGDYFISSFDTERFELDWKTEEIQFNTKRLNLVGPQMAGVSSVCTEYLKRKPYCYGRSTFSVRTKTLNGKEFVDIGLIDYRPKGMPSSAFASLILPGLGSLKVTHGRKGWLSMVGFFTMAGSAVVFESLSAQRYTSYKAATDQEQTTRLYNEANNMHKASLVCASLATTIYVSDFIRALSVASKNKRNSERLKAAVKKNSFEVQYQPLSY
jgi:tetratricopeptide (TPR) repeat protein